MNREDYRRIDGKLTEIPNTSSDWLILIAKVKETEVLQEISESLKSIAASLRGDKL